MSNTHKPADILSNVQNYSINLLWVNNKAKDQAYIYDTNTQDELVAKFLMPAIRWAVRILQQMSIFVMILPFMNRILF